MASARSLESLSLLFKWKGSLFKLVYRELLVFVASFVVVSVVYHHANIGDEQKRNFVILIKYCKQYLDMIPLSFILGFYVTIIATRWWTQCMTLPWPDKVFLAVAMCIPGTDEESRLLRKTLCSCCNLMAVLLFRSISESVGTRMKTLQDVVDAGFMTKEEKDMFESVKADVGIWWLPALWFSHYLQDAQKRGQIMLNDGARLIMTEMLEFRAKCGSLWVFDWRTIPLVYTQVVTFATYTFVAASVIGRQRVYELGTPIADVPFDAYFPFATSLQVLFYVGLLRVAENMVDPYGDDDEDFDLNWLINRHAKAIHLATDELCYHIPKMTRRLGTVVSSTAASINVSSSAVVVVNSRDISEPMMTSATASDMKHKTRYCCCTEVSDEDAHRQRYKETFTTVM